MLGLRIWLMTFACLFDLATGRYQRWVETAKAKRRLHFAVVRSRATTLHPK